jgi:hypothetical protein
MPYAEARALLLPARSSVRLQATRKRSEQSQITSCFDQPDGTGGMSRALKIDPSLWPTLSTLLAEYLD